MFPTPWLSHSSMQSSESEDEGKPVQPKRKQEEDNVAAPAKRAKVTFSLQLWYLYYGAIAHVLQRACM